MIPVEVLHIDPHHLQADESVVEQFISGGDAAMIAHTRDLVERLRINCMELSEPAAAILSLEAETIADKGKIAAGGLVFETGGTVSKMLRGSDEYAFFLSTLGPGPEELSRNFLNEGAYLEAYIVDMLASSMADAVSTFTHEHIRKTAAERKLNVSNRYSPGYCGWKVDEQQKLFSLFPDACCGISLSASCLMTPIKSVSGVIGMGAKVKFRDYTCELCDMFDCVYRRIREAS